MSENGKLIICWYCGKKTAQEEEKCVHCGTVLIADQEESDIEGLLESIGEEKTEEPVHPVDEEEQVGSSFDSVPRPPITLSEEEFDFPPSHQPFTPPPPPPTTSRTEEEDSGGVPKPMTAEAPIVPAPEIPTDETEEIGVPKPLDEDQLFSTSQKGIPVPKGEPEQETVPPKEEEGESLGFSVPMPAYEPEDSTEPIEEKMPPPAVPTLPQENVVTEQSAETEITVAEVAEAPEVALPIEEEQPQMEIEKKKKATLLWPLLKYYALAVPIVFLFGFTSVRLSNPDYEYQPMTFPDKNYVDYLSIIPLIAIFVFVVIGYLAQALVVDHMISRKTKSKRAILATLGITPLAISSVLAVVLSLALQGTDITVVQISLFGAMIIPWASFIAFGWLFFYFSAQLTRMRGEKRMAAAISN